MATGPTTADVPSHAQSVGGDGPTYDVIVVGAGPGGIAAALAATARGLDVVVVDKATFPRDKTCGDGLTATALRTYRYLGFEPETLPGYAPVDETVVRSPSGREIHLPVGPGQIGVVARNELDDAFVEHARARGVEVREGATVVEVTPSADDVAVVIEDGTHGGDTVLRARWIIGADGHWSPVRRRLEGDRHRTDLGAWHAYRQYFAGVDDPRLWVLFEPELLPGYAWVFPLPDGGANVGFGVRRGPGTHGKELAAHWRRLLDSSALTDVLGPDAKAEGTPRAWPIPTDFDPELLAAERTLFVGDAAHVVDPMTGEGIAQALVTGVIAAHAIATGTTAADVVGVYRDEVTRTLGRDLRFAELLGRVLRSPLGARGCVRLAGVTDWTRRNFARWLFEDYPRAVVFTPDRWAKAHRGP